MGPVASVSAGPPLGGLYLKPPSRGGLCDGVTTMPSDRSPSRSRLKVRIAWLTAAVGVKRSAESIIPTTSFAASTSSAHPPPPPHTPCLPPPLTIPPSLPSPPP